MLKIHYNQDLDKCFCCGRNNKQKHIRYWGNEEEKSLKLVEFVYNCAGCRNKYQKLKTLRDKERMLKAQMVELEYELFCANY